MFILHVNAHALTHSIYMSTVDYPHIIFHGVNDKVYNMQLHDLISRNHSWQGIHCIIYGNCTFHIPRNLTEELASPALAMIHMVALMMSIWLDQRWVDMRPCACTVALDLLSPRQIPSRGHRLMNDADVLTADPRLQLSHEAVIELGYLYVGFCNAALDFPFHYTALQLQLCNHPTLFHILCLPRFTGMQPWLPGSAHFVVNGIGSSRSCFHRWWTIPSDVCFTVCIKVLPGFMLTFIHGGTQMVTDLASGARGFLFSPATQHRVRVWTLALFLCGFFKI